MNSYVVLYLILGTLSGFIEIGAVIYVYQRTHNILTAVTFGLLYQIGTIASYPIQLKLTWYIVAGVLSLAVSFISDSLAIQGVSLILLSATLHGLRKLSPGKKHLSTALKRWSRVVGFVFSSVFTMTAIPVASGICILVGGLYASKPQSIKRESAFSLKEGSMAWVMLIHQSHYFVYAYALPCAYLSVYKQSAWMTAIWFSLGWLSYTLAERLLGGFGNTRMVIWGHVLAAVALLSLASTLGFSLILTVGLWFLTGFGGGTVYGVRRIATARSDISDLDSWENLGHVVGVAVSLLFLVIIPVISVVFAVAGLLAVSTALCFRAVGCSVEAEGKQDTDVMSVN